MSDKIRGRWVKTAGLKYRVGPGLEVRLAVEHLRQER